MTKARDIADSELGSLTVDTDTLVVDETNNRVGIGTTSPNALLAINSATNGAYAQRIGVDDPGVGTASSVKLGFDVKPIGSHPEPAAYIGVEEASVSSVQGQLTFATRQINNNTVAPSEAMRIDSSGNLLVGKTSANTATAGVEALSNGEMNATVNGGRVISLDRLGSDGEIIRLRRSSSTVGSIRTFGGVFHLGSGDTFLRFQSADNSVRPCTASGANRDNSIDLGDGTARFDDIYATNGTIQTSDRNEKQDIAELDEAERRVAVAAKGLLRKFRWKDAVEEKGDDARIHFGIIAQDLQDAFTAEGLDAGRYAMFISSTWWEATETYTDDDGVEQTRTNTYETLESAPEGATERTRMGVRYPELLAFIIAAI